MLELHLAVVETLKVSECHQKTYFHLVSQCGFFNLPKLGICAKWVAACSTYYVSIVPEPNNLVIRK